MYVYKFLKNIKYSITIFMPNQGFSITVLILLYELISIDFLRSRINFKLSTLINHLTNSYPPTSSFYLHLFLTHILWCCFYKPFFSKNHHNNSNNYHSHRYQFCLRRLPTENIVFGIHSYFFDKKPFYTIKN